MNQVPIHTKYGIIIRLENSIIKDLFYKPDLGSDEYVTLHSNLENTLIEIGKQIYIEEIRLEEVLTIFKT